MKRLSAIALVLAIAVVTSAHVGSPDAFFDGTAGPYKIHVRVSPPSVVPGLASIYVRTDEADVTAITARPVFWRAGLQGAPRGDSLRVVVAHGLFSGQLWLMSRGSYSIHLDVDGARGKHTAVVPVMAMATGRLGLSTPLIVVLAALGLLLLGGLVAIVRAAASDSLVDPSEEPDQIARRRGSLGAAIAVPVLLLIVFGGARWWRAEDQAYSNTMYRPLRAAATVLTDGDAIVLRLAILDTAPERLLTAPIMPDHGKLMHLFLVKESSMSAFAHLHPVRERENLFMTDLPALPAGRYFVYGDVVLETGAEYTVTTKVDVPPALYDRTQDPDDSWDTDSFGVPARAGSLSHLNDNIDLQWDGRDSLVAGRDVELSFSARNKLGVVVPVQPYLGLVAHAVVMKDDGTVFAHLHPSGTATMAARQAFDQRIAGDTLDNGRLKPMKMNMKEPATLPGQFSFPYAFPSPGRYRMWVQTKLDNKVETADYEVIVR